jgi:rhodanese-related sulfurtransferase
MRKTLTLVAACMFAIGVAGQYKKSAPNAKIMGNSATAADKQQLVEAVAHVKRISEKEAFRLQTNGSAVIVDVRSNTQFQQGHIKGAISIPRSQIVTRFKELPPRKMVITYCACGAEEASGQAVLDLNNHGVKNTAALKGGLNAWKVAQLPMQAGPQ